MKTYKLLFLFLLAFLFIACALIPATPDTVRTTGTPVSNLTSSPETADVEQARQTLVTFFEHLHQGNYAEADALYGGEYDELMSFSFDADPNDHSTLWQNACQMSGLQCLEVRSATFTNHNNGEYIFLVEFSNPDGDLFVFGPCCGATEAEMPPQSQFEYRVAEIAEGRYVVMGLPIFVP